MFSKSFPINLILYLHDQTDDHYLEPFDQDNHDRVSWSIFHYSVVILMAFPSSEFKSMTRLIAKLMNDR